MGVYPLDLSKTIAERVAVPNHWGSERAYTDAIIQQLRNDQLMGVAVPQSHGGPGLDISDIARITYDVARISSSAGLIYAMHMSQAISLVRHAPATLFFDDFMRRMVREQMLIGSGTTEAGVGGDIFGSLCTIEQTEDGGFSLTKDCPIISYFNHCGAVLITAMREQPNGKKVQVLITGEVSKMDWTDGAEMDLTGMRGIVNKGYRLTAHFDEDAIFPENFPEIQRATMTPAINILWAAVWSGMAWQAIDRAKQYLAKAGTKDPDVAPVMRFQLSKLSDKHYTMNAIIRDSIAEDASMADADMTRRMAQTTHNARMKVICSELLQDICREAMGIIGMESYAMDGPYSLSELARDAMSGMLMVSNYRLAVRNAKVERFVEENL